MINSVSSNKCAFVHCVNDHHHHHHHALQMKNKGIQCKMLCSIYLAYTAFCNSLVRLWSVIYYTMISHLLELAFVACKMRQCNAMQCNAMTLDLMWRIRKRCNMWRSFEIKFWQLNMIGLLSFLSKKNLSIQWNHTAAAHSFDTLYKISVCQYFLSDRDEQRKQ